MPWNRRSLPSPLICVWILVVVLGIGLGRQVLLITQRSNNRRIPSEPGKAGDWPRSSEEEEREGETVEEEPPSTFNVHGARWRGPDFLTANPRVSKAFQQRISRIGVLAFPSDAVIGEIVENIPTKNGERVPVYLVYLDMSYLKLTLNWICNVDKFQTVLNRTIFVAFDLTSHNALQKLSNSRKYQGKQGLRLVYEQYKVKKQKWGKKEARYGGYLYFTMMLFRTRIEKLLLENGVNFFLVEADATWHLDPGDYLFNLAGDVVALNDGYDGDRVINHGFSSFRPRPRVLEFFKELERLQATKSRTGDNANEQYYMQTLLATNFTDLDVTYLDSNLFCNGREYLKKSPGFDPWVRHNNYMIGTANKINRTKIGGWWYLDKDEKCIDH